MFDNEDDVSAPWAAAAPWADVPFGSWEATHFVAWLEDFRRWAAATGYEWDHGESLADALTMWRLDEGRRLQAEADAEGDRQARERQAREQADRDRQAHEQAERDRQATAARMRAQADRDHWAALVANETRRTADDPGSLRAVVAWRRVTPDIALTISDKAALAALRAEGLRLDVDLAANAEAMRSAEAQHVTERLVRLARGEQPVKIPARLDLSTYVDSDAIARWLVFHDGSYTLTVGRWRTREERDEDTDAVTSSSRVLYQPAGWEAIARACARWATWRLFATDARAHPEDADRLTTAGLDALRGVEQYAELIADQRGSWSFTPADDEAEGTSETEPRTVAKGGRPALTDDKLRRKIERTVNRFWYEHKRGPSRNELTDAIGATRSRVLAMIGTMVAEGDLMEGGHRDGLWIDD